MTIAAPLPVFGFFDEAFFDRIAMDVAELFDKFLLRENVEVEVADLPELLTIALEVFRSLTL
jgi:hypothetical protein